ncbi:hypothetical protein PpBr36_03656 [Pyricularia pennisetigena]|uniref:hypothetical protein n=1 Tax=Pyricularia pennisetigena TaxID=1578925 RepID=UPI001151C575|nr:hypothetical protein PpBr36_03656 [Pyricularia pennisetigena]TLS30538.1 hypothetical protein PpBr36_03656 [Pyricularia pennisetigena]
MTMTSPAHRPPASSLSIPHEQAQSAALKGASLAFQKQLDANKKKKKKSSPPSANNKPISDGGALVAATSAASLSNQTTGGSSVADHGVPEHATLSNRLAQLQQRSGSPHLRPPGSAGGPRSASFIAATLAASRSSSPSPSRKNSVATPQGQRRRARAHSRASSVGSLQLTSPSNLGPSPGQGVDSGGYDGEVDADLDQEEDTGFRRLGRRKVVAETPTFPAREQSRRRDGDPVKSPSPVRDSEVPQPRGKVIDRVPEQEEPESPVQKARPKLKPKPKPKPDKTIKTEPRAAPELVESKRTGPDPVSEPTSPSIRRISAIQPKPKVTRAQPARAPIKTYDSQKEIQVLSRIIMPKDVDDIDYCDLTWDGTRDPPFRERTDSISSDDTFFSTSSGQGRRAPTPPPPRRARSVRETPSRPQSAASPPSSQQRPVSSHSRQTPTGANRPSLALDSLTNAIVASSLASARHAPASRPQTPATVPVPSRKRNDRLAPNLTGGGLSRSHSRSPPKKQGMLTTLRAPQSKSDDEEARKYRERHRKRGPLGGKKHVHHEGSRRRWRDSVTAEERRRYEALWASNRGLLLPPKDGTGQQQQQQQQPQDLVANVIVRDLWSRSRLPHDELAEVWDLVDLNRRGSLSKEEFVVGMWLIDMRLRGRKIPPRVGQSVWDSVKGLRVPPPA